VAVRRITTRGEGPTPALDEALQVALVAELFHGSKNMWLLSPWVSDIPVIDNSGGELAGLVPGAPLRRLRLTEVLGRLADGGTRITVVVRDDPHNEPVIAKLRALNDASKNVRVIVSENLHDKGLLTSRIYFEGSMNFTHRGREVNEEGVTITRDSDLLSRMHLDFVARFGEPDE
jgi:hypothetical protein